MCKTAYDECYLDSMIQKNRYLFKLIARNCSDAFGTITDYMNSDYRKRMDMGNVFPMIREIYLWRMVGE